MNRNSKDEVERLATTFNKKLIMLERSSSDILDDIADVKKRVNHIERSQHNSQIRLETDRNSIEKLEAITQELKSDVNVCYVEKKTHGFIKKIENQQVNMAKHFLGLIEAVQCMESQLKKVIDDNEALTEKVKSLEADKDILMNTLKRRKTAVDSSNDSPSPSSPEMAIRTTTPEHPSNTGPSYYFPTPPPGTPVMYYYPHNGGYPYSQ